MKRSPVWWGLVAPGTVTWTCTEPAEPDGLTAVMVVAEWKVKLRAGLEPNVTAVTPVNPVPVMVTVVPPESGPADGLSEVTIGGTQSPAGELVVPTLWVHVLAVPDVLTPVLWSTQS